MCDQFVSFRTCFKLYVSVLNFSSSYLSSVLAVSADHSCLSLCVLFVINLDVFVSVVCHGFI